MEVGIYKYDSSLPNCLKFFSNSTSLQPTIGFAMMPKSAVNIRKHEVDRAVRVINNKTIIYQGFTLKNRTDTFQPELYPPFGGATPSNSVAEWAAGNDKPPTMEEITEEDWDA